MATLATDTPRVFETGHDEYVNSLPMIDNDIIYDGAAVGESGTSGTFRPLVSGDQFAGFAVAQADNTGTGHAAGAVNVDVKQAGRVKLSVTGASAVTDMDAKVFATDDNTFTLTPSGTTIGRVARWVTGTYCIVDFDARKQAADTFSVSTTVELHASRTVVNVFTAPRKCRVTGLKWVQNVVQGGALTGCVVAATGTATPAFATTPLTAQTAIDFNGVAVHTVQALALTATAANLVLAAGDRVALVESGAMTAGSGVLTVEVEYL